MKTIILNEGQMKTILKMEITPRGMKQTTCAIYPNKVLIVKKFLDGFQRGESEDMGEDGMMHITPCFGQKDSKGCVVRNLYQNDMLDLLNHQYPHLYSNVDDNSRFLSRVMEDWYNNKITPFGGLSVNFV